MAKHTGTLSTPAERVIVKCGGHQIVADWLGLDISRVYRFTYPKDAGGTGGIIPANHQPTLLQKAREEGKDLSPADFFDEAGAAA